MYIYIYNTNTFPDSLWFGLDRFSPHSYHYFNGMCVMVWSMSYCVNKWLQCFRKEFVPMWSFHNTSHCNNNRVGVDDIDAMMAKKCHPNWLFVKVKIILLVFYSLWPCSMAKSLSITRWLSFIRNSIWVSQSVVYQRVAIVLCNIWPFGV